MLPEAILKQLQSENDLLKVQLQDANDKLHLREQEIKLLSKKSLEVAELQSKLSMTQDEIYQMQDLIGDQQHKAAGAAKREASLENELLQFINVESEYYNLKAKLETSQARIYDLSSEADSIPSLNKEIAGLIARIAELESNLEICALENNILKEDLAAYKRGKD